jgi:hypothetical protein
MNMIRPFVPCVLAAFLLATAMGVAAPPDVPKSLTVGAGKVKEFEVKADGSKDFGFRLTGGPAAFREMKSDDPQTRVFWLIPETDAALSIVWWTVGEKASAVTEINKGLIPVPPGPDPIPPPKPVPPPDPKPAPVTTFQVILVYESAATLTIPQKSVMYGVALEQYLDANCTGGKKGWDRRDDDTEPVADTTALKGPWTAAKKSLKPTDPPCVVIVVNDKVFIEPLSLTTAEQIKVLDKYREGK